MNYLKCSIDNIKDLLYIIKRNIEITFQNTINDLEIESENMVELDFKKGDGILPAIAQDFKSGKVLMLAYMNSHAWRLTLQTGEAH